MIIDLQLIGFYHRFIGFQKKKKKKKILGHFNLFIFKALIFVTIKSSFEFYKNRILITLNRTHLSQTLKAFRISA